MQEMFSGTQKHNFPCHQYQVLTRCPYVVCVQPSCCSSPWLWHVGGQGQCLIWLQGGSATAAACWWPGCSAGHILWYQQIKEGIPKWHPLALVLVRWTKTKKWFLFLSLSLGEVPAIFCFSSRCFKVSKWVSFTYGPCAFQISVLALFPGGVSLLRPFKIFHPYSFSFPKHNSY